MTVGERAELREGIKSERTAKNEAPRGGQHAGMVWIRGIYSGTHAPSGLVLREGIFQGCVVRGLCNVSHGVVEITGENSSFLAN